MMKTKQAEVISYLPVLKARLEEKQAQLNLDRANLLTSGWSNSNAAWIDLYEDQTVITMVRGILQALSRKERGFMALESVASQYSEDIVQEADAWLQSWIRSQ